MRMLLPILLVLPFPAVAADFSCRNAEAEIRCDNGKCEVATESFTPMGVSRTGNILEVCAYSGCWKGPVLVRRSRGNIDLLYADLKNSDSVAVIYDRKQRVAQMRWGGFANSMTCG
jgi:hypothetical protein